MPRSPLTPARQQSARPAGGAAGGAGAPPPPWQDDDEIETSRQALERSAVQARRPPTRPVNRRRYPSRHCGHDGAPPTRRPAHPSRHCGHGGGSSHGGEAAALRSRRSGHGGEITAARSRWRVTVAGHGGGSRRRGPPARHCSLTSRLQPTAPLPSPHVNDDDAIVNVII